MPTRKTRGCQAAGTAERSAGEESRAHQPPPGRPGRGQEAIYNRTEGARGRGRRGACLRPEVGQAQTRGRRRPSPDQEQGSTRPGDGGSRAETRGRRRQSPGKEQGSTRPGAGGGLSPD
ncbi:hypothetical protein NDU88_000615 [Pleurodeles waltl]|uniref:Uncharacterized protein n=1 Tax=Pleurodeles waltl TaxID=8319 RepID=A0AAV7LWB5_PLEWA|nr:hypothetical protein NDU88_000615 [Pleurodeles waltl]